MFGRLKEWLEVDVMDVREGELVLHFLSLSALAEARRRK